MVNRKQNRENRHIPVTSININIPHIFSISTTEKKWNKFKETFYNTGERAHAYLKRKFLEESLGVNNLNELLNSDDEISEAHKKEKNAILNASDLNRNKFSKEINRIIDEKIEKSKNEQNK